MATITWNSAVDGDWSVGANWNPNTVPGTADLALITLPGAYNVELTDDRGIGDVSLDNAGATLAISASIDLSGTLTDTAGVLAFQNAVLAGGTVVMAGGSDSFAPGGNVALDGVTWQGTLALDGPTSDIGSGSEVRIDNGLTLLGTAEVTGDEAVLLFQGGQTFDNATVLLGGSSSAASLQFSVGGSGSLVLGGALIIDSTAAGTSAVIEPALSASGSVVNDGTINATASAGAFGITAAIDFTNSGLIHVGNGDRLGINPGSGSIVNNGTIAVDIGSSLLLNNNGNLATYATAFQNPGEIDLAAGSTLTLHSIFSALSMGNVVNNGATIVLNGTFENQGQTMTPGPGSLFGTHEILSGLLAGGTLVPGAFFSIGNLSSGAASLSGVTVQGTLDASASTANLTLRSGNVFTDAGGSGPGTILADGASGSLHLDSISTLDSVTVLLGNSIDFDTVVTKTLTLGSSVTLESTAAGGLVLMSGTSTAPVLNQGLVMAASNGGTFQLRSELLTNNGTIAVSNGDFFTTRLSTLQSPIDSAAGAGIISLATGGTVELGPVDAGQTLQILDDTGTLMLDQVTAFAAEITGFQPGNTIDLVSTQATAATGGLNALTIDLAGGTTATLDLDGDYTGKTFNLVYHAPAGTVITESAACFAAGTRIRTDAGDRAVELLRVGDRVLALHRGGLAEIMWIGHRRLRPADHRRPRDMQPVRIAAHAFGPGEPHTPLLLSPDHAVYLDGALIPIRYLLNDATIVQRTVPSVTYFHIELDRHDVLLAQGLPAESYLDTGNRHAFANGGAAIAAHPDFAREIWDSRGCAPLLTSGTRLQAVQHRLLARAEELGFALTDEPDLLVLAGGRVLARVGASGLLRAALPAGLEEIRLQSRHVVPARVWPGNADHRCLGVAIAFLSLDGRPVLHDDPRRRQGWHLPEPGLQWTSGDAVLRIDGARHLELRLAPLLKYWLPRGLTMAPLASLACTTGAQRRKDSEWTRSPC